jgi:hypothetical protein
MSGAIPPLPQYASMAWCSVKTQGKLYLLNYLSYLCTLIRVVHEKLILIQLVKKFPAFMECEISLARSQEPATERYTEPDESSSHTLTPHFF